MKRTQLALEYFPDSSPSVARRRLTKWIHNCTELYEQLTKDCRKFDGRQELTIREVRLIKYYLGEL